MRGATFKYKKKVTSVKQAVNFNVNMLCALSVLTQSGTQVFN